MTHSGIHLLAGVLLATGLCTPRILEAWRNKTPLAPPLGRWLLLSYALGLYALIPSFLRHAGLPDSVCRGWGMNIFLLHPWIKSLNLGGKIAGGAAILAVVSLHYGTLLLALRRIARQSDTRN